jgi:release factor glutamine methyltransferase
MLKSPGDLSETLRHVAAQLRDGGIGDFAAEATQIIAAAGENAEAACAMACRRVSGEPMALILGRTTFRGLALQVPPGTLAPRPETEALVERATRLVRETRIDEPRVIDMCCGTGNIAVAIAVELPGATVFASDLTKQCVTAARQNVEMHGLRSRVTIAEGDLFEPLRGRGLEGTVDLVTCNPPYISTGRLESDAAELLRHEPREAFDAGPYGLNIHQRVIKIALEFLRPGGWLVFEYGAGQGRQLQLLLRRAQAYDEIDTTDHGPGAAGVASARKTAPSAQA